MKNKKIFSDATQRKLGVVLSYIIIILNFVVSVGYTPILTTKLGQSEYGLYSLVSSFISYLTLLDMGFGNAIIVYTSRYRAKNDKEREASLYGMFLVIYILIGIVSTVLGMILLQNVEVLFGRTMTSTEILQAKKLMMVLVINLAFTFPLSIFSSIVTAYERYIFAKIVNIIRIVLMPCIMIPLLYMGYKSFALVIVVTILNLSSLLINCIYCFKVLKIQIKFGLMNFSLLIEIFAYSFWVFLNTLVDKINWSLDNFLLGSMVGTISVSVYAIASQINQLYISFSTGISGVLLPKVTQMVESGASDRELSSILVRTGRLQLIIVGLILSGFTIFGKHFIFLWVGEAYEESYYIALALMIPMIVSLIQNSGTSIMQAKNKQKFMSIVLVCTSILNVFVSIPLIQSYGGFGAAIGTAISLFVGNILIKNIYYYRVLKIDVILFFKEVSAMGGYITILTFLLCIVMSRISIDSWLLLFGDIAIYCIIYVTGLYFFLNDYEKELFFKPINKLFRKRFKNE